MTKKELVKEIIKINVEKNKYGFVEKKNIDDKFFKYLKDIKKEEKEAIRGQYTYSLDEIDTHLYTSEGSRVDVYLLIKTDWADVYEDDDNGDFSERANELCIGRHSFSCGMLITEPEGDDLDNWSQGYFETISGETYMINYRRMDYDFKKRVYESMDFWYGNGDSPYNWSEEGDSASDRDDVVLFEDMEIHNSITRESRMKPIDIRSDWNKFLQI